MLFSFILIDVIRLAQSILRPFQKVLLFLIHLLAAVLFNLAGNNIKGESLYMQGQYTFVLSCKRQPPLSRFGYSNFQLGHNKECTCITNVMLYKTL